MEWIAAHFFKLTTLLLTIVIIRQGLYPEQTRYFFSQVPRYLKQWAQWMERPWPIMVGRYQAAFISPMMVLGWVYQICIGMLMVLTVILAFLGSLNVVFTGLPAHRMILGCFLCAAMLYALYRIRKMPGDE